MSISAEIQPTSRTIEVMVPRRREQVARMSETSQQATPAAERDAESRAL